MGEVTEPGAPPDATPKYVRPAEVAAPTDPDADLAASLLHDLARTSLPTNGIPETSGQNAASYAVSARRPPRAMEDVTLEPAVVVNLTEPLPMAFTPLPTTASRDATTLVGPRRGTDPDDPRGRRTMPATRMVQGPRALEKTVLGPRAQRRQVLLGIVSVIGVATVVAIGILALAPRMRRSAVSSTAPSELTAATTDGVTVVTSTATALPAPTIAPPLEPAPPVSAIVIAPPPPPSPPPVVTTAAPRPTARGAGSSRPAAAPKAAPPKPAGTFEEPDRSF